MEFDEALKRAKDGKKMRRENWPKGQYIQIQLCLVSKNTDIEASTSLLYTATQNDLIATDWITLGGADI